MRRIIPLFANERLAWLVPFLGLLLVSCCYSNPRHLAIRIDASGTITGYHSTSDPTPPAGMQLVPWVDISRPDLVPRAKKHRGVHHYRLVEGVIQRRPDSDVDADDLAERVKDAKRELLELKRQRRDLAEDVKAGDADQMDLDALDATIAAKRAEIQGMR